MVMFLYHVAGVTRKEKKVRSRSACLSRTCVLLLFEAWLCILHSSFLQLNELPVDERQKKSSLRGTSSSAVSSCFATRSGSADPSTADLCFANVADDLVALALVGCRVRPARCRLANNSVCVTRCHCLQVGGIQEHEGQGT